MPVSLARPRPPPASSDDFPSLSRRSVAPLPASSSTASTASTATLTAASLVTAPASLTNRYADLARSWGVQKKEEEEKAKKAEKDSALQARLLREKEEKERRFFRISATNATSLLNRRSAEDMPLEEEDRVVLDDYDSGEDPVEEDDSEHGYDAEELDAGWNQRRHKNDLY